MTIFDIPNATDTAIEYYAIAYYRLSREDRGKNESDSIANQRMLVSAYLKNHPNIQLVTEAQDDGYTGTNFDRPGFRVVMEAIREKKVNCVIVKDLSRLGREYIEMGKYLEMIFPSFGIRFIAINDDVDSEKENDSDDIIIPVKNIMNESYCRKISKELRKQFRTQRENGEYMGAFVSYGYLKSVEDKHKIVIDEYAAEVVKGIFVLKMKGYSQDSIAEFLNKEQILPPAEYKKSIGINYKSGFSRPGTAKWTAKTITRILTNPIYVGVLEQGKRGTPNYKVKEMRYRDKEDWVVVKEKHEPIIDELIFMIVQQILQRDTRRTPSSDNVQPLSGVVVCGDCNRNMCIKYVTSGKKKFYYYVCRNFKYEKSCTSHNFEKTKLETIVLNAINQQINLTVELRDLLEKVGMNNLVNLRVRKLDLLIAKKNQELDGYRDYRMNLYEALNDGLIEKDEYHRMRGKYNSLISEGEAVLEKLYIEREAELSGSTDNTSWIQAFIDYEGSTELTRELVVTLIDKIYIFEDKRVKIDFNYRNEFQYYQNLLQQNQEQVKGVG
jgi:DNA invertase Pin-like site-specific DNA recombinase